MKRFFAVLMLVSVVTLAGCGSSGGGSDASGTTKPSGAGGSTTAASGSAGADPTGGDAFDACTLLSPSEASKVSGAKVTDTVPATAGTTVTCGYGGGGGVPAVLLYVYPPKDAPIEGTPIPGLGPNSGITPLFAKYHGKKHNYQVTAVGDGDAEREANSIAALKIILDKAGEK